MITDIDATVIEYVTLQDRIKELTSKRDAVNQALKSFIQDNGDVDDKDNFTISFEGKTVAGVYGVQNQARVKTSLDMDAAEEILRAKGLWDSCVEMVPKLDDDAIAAARFEDKLTQEELERIYPRETTWSLVMVKKPC